MSEWDEEGSEHLPSHSLDCFPSGKVWVQENIKPFTPRILRRLCGQMWRRAHTQRTSLHNKCSVVFWSVDMTPDMLTHYHIHSLHSRKVLHKECKITVGNKGTQRDLYLSCSDIYFRRRSSTSIIFFSQTQTRTHIQREEFHIFGLNKVIYLPCVMSQLCCSFKVWVTLRITYRQDKTLYTAW